jgi:hypothetical protein
MKLITQEIAKQLKQAGYYGKTPICKFFNPCGAATWVIFGQDEENPDILFCVADLGMGFVEAGPVSLSELESVKLSFGLGIERDIHFTADDRTFEDFCNMESLAGC